MRLFLFLLLVLLAPVWGEQTQVVRVRHGDVQEAKALLQVLVPEVTCEVLLNPPRLRVTGASPEAVVQVLEILAELDRPPDRLELDVSLVDTRGLFGDTRDFAALPVPGWPGMFQLAYRWPPRVVDSDKDVVYSLGNLRLNLKPSVKADGYVVWELRPEVGQRSLNTSLRVAPGEMVLLWGAFSEADAERALRDGPPELSAVFAPIGRPSNLAVAIRWRVLSP